MKTLPAKATFPVRATLLALAATTGCLGIEATAQEGKSVPESVKALYKITPAEALKIVNARLRELAPIIRTAPSELEKHNFTKIEISFCAAQAAVYVKAVIALRDDKFGNHMWRRKLATADMSDLVEMTKFAACIGQFGTTGMLSPCSEAGQDIVTKLAGSVFDARRLDVNGEKCPKR